MNREPGPLKQAMNKKPTKPDAVAPQRVEEIKSAETPHCHECGTPTQRGAGTPKHLQCPSCFGGRGGTGKERWWQRVSGTRVRRCYVCQVCGFDWTVDERVTREIISIEHAEVTVEHRPGPQIETRS